MQEKNRYTDLQTQCKKILQQLGSHVADSHSENKTVNNNTYTVIHKNGTVTTHTIMPTKLPQKEYERIKAEVKEIEKAAREPIISWKKHGKFNFSSFVMEPPIATVAEMKALENGDLLPTISSY